MDRCFDVIVVGASVAGCRLALRLADQGYQVALLEKRIDPDAYKVMCSHLLHPNVVTALKDYDLWPELQCKGAQQTYLDVQISNRHLYYPFGRQATMANVERRLLDPALRARALQHPGVTYFGGIRVDALYRGLNGRIEGVAVHAVDQSKCILRAPLTVGADGKGSAMAALAGISECVLDNRREAFFAYYEAQTQACASRVQVQARGRSYVAVFPNGPKVLVSCYLPKEHPVAQRKLNAETYFDQLLQTSLKDIPIGKRLSKVIAARETSTQYRRHICNGFTLVGDAYLAADPLTGVGCSWALRSADMLADSLGPVWSEARSKISIRRHIDKALARYRAHHFRSLALQSFVLAFVSTHGEWLTHPALVRPLAWITARLASRQSLAIAG